MIKPVVLSSKITDVSCTSLKIYLQEISRYPILSKDEEVKYGSMAFRGDEKAITLLIECNLRFVVSVAKLYVDANCPLEDLINEGNEGLIIAASKFDPSKGFKFISYAVWWIRNRIMEYKYNHSRSIRIPINKINDLIKLNDDFVKLIGNSDTPTNELATAKWTEEKIQEICRLNSLTVISLEHNISHEEDSNATLIDVIPNENSEKTDHLLDSYDKDVKLNSFLSKLTTRQRDVIEKLFGLNGQAPMTLTEVGQEYGLSRERIRQIRDRAILCLRTKAVKSKYTLNTFRKDSD